MQRKRSSDDPDQPKTAFRKRRALSGFNLSPLSVALTLHAIFWYANTNVHNCIHNNSLTLHAESQQFSSLAEKNKQSALKWKSLTDEERRRYCTEATAF